MSNMKEYVVSEEDLAEATPAEAMEVAIEEMVEIPLEGKTSSYKDLTVPGGKLRVNVWRSTNKKQSGNTYEWDYQVSAVYTGTKTVSKIRITWYASASLRNSASISLGISGTSVTAGAGSSWQTVKTKTKYWENSNGAKTSDYRSNVVIGPAKDYREDTITVYATARVVLSGDAKPYEVSKGV